ESRDRRLRECRANATQFPILGAEIVPPFGDAVSLVNGNQRNWDVAQKAQEAGRHQSLRGHVEELDVAASDRALTPADLARIERAVDERRGHTHGFERVDL